MKKIKLFFHAWKKAIDLNFLLAYNYEINLHVSRDINKDIGAPNKDAGHMVISVIVEDRPAVIAKISQLMMRNMFEYTDCEEIK